MTLPEPHADDPGPAAWVSDLVDGRLDGADLAQRCADWSCDASARQRWHAYHLIGDVMRSDELAQPPGHDAAFIDRLRGRLAQEPVVLAPEPQARRRSHRQVWLLPMAVAAGFVAVAGVAVVLQASAPTATEVGPQRAQGPAGSDARPIQVAAPVREEDMLRDARIDEYLRMHRQTIAGAPVALPGGAMRSVDLTVPQR